MMEGRLLHELPTGEETQLNLVQLEQVRGNHESLPFTYMYWLRTHQVFWHSIQGHIVDKLHVAMLSAMQVIMLAQALTAARGNFLPDGAVREMTYRPLLPNQACRTSRKPGGGSSRTL